MKIISGELKGKELQTAANSRPITEKNRAAIFNVLGNIGGLSVLDLFAGSGALAIEAISRGASNAVLIDNSVQAARAIRHNIKHCSTGDVVKFIRQNVVTFLNENNPKLYDLIFIDPPYSEFHEKYVTLADKLLSEKGIVVVSCSKYTNLSDTIATLHKQIEKNYGDTKIAFYQHA